MQTETSPEVFTTFPGRCYRLTNDGHGHLDHCPRRPVCTGCLTDGRGSTWTVDACEEHAAELSRVR